MGKTPVQGCAWRMPSPPARALTLICLVSCLKITDFTREWWQVEKAPLESYADVGGLEQQITEIKEAVELPLTHPELYEDIGIKPPKVSSTAQSAVALKLAGRCMLPRPESEQQFPVPQACLSVCIPFPDQRFL